MEKRIVSYENDTAIIEEFKTITITRDYLEAKAIELKERRDVANHQANEAANEIQVIAEEEIELAKARELFEQAEKTFVTVEETPEQAVFQGGY